MKRKSILIIAALGILGGIGGWLYAKQRSALKVFDKIGVKVRGVDSIRFDFEKIRFRIKLSLVNNTDINFGLDVGSFSVKKIRIYTLNEKLLASGNMNATNIILPANGEYNIPPMEVSVRVSELSEFVLKNLKDLGKLADKLNYEVDVRAFGINYTIKQ